MLFSFSIDMPQLLRAASVATRGWVWNGYQMKGTTDKIGLGWVSLNCLNDFDNDGYLENECEIGAGARPYGLSFELGADATLNGVNDYVQGCSWSAGYGWVCFNGGTTAQCSTLLGTPSGNPNSAACADLDPNGVAIKKFGRCSVTIATACTQDSNCPGGEKCVSFQYLDSPTYTAGTWGSLSSTQHANILSLWSSADSAKSYVSFPQGLTGASYTDATMFGCFGCDTTTKKCSACLNVSTESADPVTNPNPNLLCWNCGNGSACTVGDQGGSCDVSRDRNTCPASSCTGGCTTLPGVIVNQNPAGDYEMCGWGYHAYNDGSSTFTNTFTTVDDQVGSNNSGEGASMAISPVDGLPFLAYISQNAANGGIAWLKTVKCGDPFCTIKSTRLIEQVFSETATAVAIGADNRPVIAYYNNSADRMTILKCGNANCSMSGKPLTLETVDGLTLSEPSILVPIDGKAVMSYRGSGGFKAFKCNDVNCATGTGPTIIDATANTGTGSSIALDLSDGFPIISYVNSPSQDLMFVHCLDATCTTFDSPALVDNGQVSGKSSMIVPTDGKPIIAYADYAGSDTLKVARCTDDMCTASTKAFIAGSGQARYISLALGTDAMPVMSYYVVASSDLRVAKCGSQSCSSGATVQTVDSGSGGITGEYSHLKVLSADGNPVIGYYDATLEALRYTKCETASCASGQSQGLGWISFGAKRIGSQAYVEGQGNIFSGGNIYSPTAPPANKYNSAYIIEASGDITNWYSQNAYKYFGVSGAPGFIEPGTQQTQVYSNVLGKLDYQGIVTDVVSGKPPTVTTVSPKNKYGSSMVYNAVGTPLAGSTVMQSNTFYWPLSTTITGGGFSCSPGQSGAGILVVNGNLTITGNITFNACTPGKIREIASPVWIVRGDLIIDPAVTQLAGTFVVLGNGSVAKCPNLTTASNGCGRFSSGASTNQLTTNGIVLAKQFKLDRAFSSATGPSEKFVSDGRLQANTPPGLTDFAKSVPRFSFGF